MILKQFLHVPAQIIANKWIHHAGYALGCIELLFGLLFLFNKKRKLAIIILILTHICILLLIGPLGLKYNIIVWPWNVYMILILMLCFLTEKEQMAIANHIKISGIKFVFICWAILPAFSIWGYWDHYLSSNLYGGNTPKASICLDDTTQLTKLKNFVCRTNAACKCTSSWQINLQQWSMREMNVPVFPEERIYKAIFKQWEQQYPHTHSKLIIYQ